MQLMLQKQKIEDFCRRWHINELALFGSVLRDDFRPDSDIDVLVSFASDGRLTFDNRPDILDELAAILGRPVDLVEERQLRNPFRRHAILTTKKVIYAA